MGLSCALAVVVSLTGLALVAPATASASHGRQHHHSHQHRAQGHHPGKHHTSKHHHGKKKASKKPAHKHKDKHKQVWIPTDGTFFNYPFSPRHDDRYRIRQQLRNAVKAAPAGSRIRFTTFSFVDARLAGSLVAADRRGVSVQVLVNRKDVKLSAPFRSLQKALGHSRRGPHGDNRRSARERASFVRTCAFSCRGSRGNLHSKIYLFSKVGHTRWVSMVGSANLTRFAAVGQWNHLNTITGKATYLRLRHVFNQMRRDRALRHPFLRFSTPKTVAWVFPRLHSTFRTDPTMRILNRISCRATPHTGVKVKHKHHKHKPKHHKQITRRTVIRIAMYAWFDGRGNALARAVRHKWNQGCDVRVIYSVLNRTVKSVLYNPSGRGRIPMRRSVVTDSMGNVVDYDHSKYVAVNGRFAGRGRSLVWTGSMNFTQLGLSSDDIIVRLSGRKVYRAYLGNFRRVWHAPTARVPLPTRG
ncbi:MAG: phospholipase D-like domain-containing protein [Marmoricola sp.]